MIIRKIKPDSDYFVTLIKVDTDTYREYLTELEEYRKNHPKTEAEIEAEDDFYVSDWLAEKLFKLAGIEPPNE